ncbi:hypothetical protein HNR40_009265 [Nonomuraea endophytica]|uniref:Uncharacterized protein n=1 Tax=Nonomuraea endophytica TaxID=714136 RepID=A0A7W8ACW2_9ACTN|nr:hypothetical protein [Nonomuraea endophytica]MBB5083760.1 hypothetical protein [Nonomuraea endophytica]
MFLDLAGKRFAGYGVAGHGCVEAGGDAFAQARGQRDRGVVGFDGLLDVEDGEVRQVAGALLTAAAHEVEIDRPRLAPTRREDEPGLAAMAPKGALEVVVVLAGSGAGAALDEQDLLYAVEEFLADQGFVSASVLDALVSDEAQVVAVSEHVSDLVDGDQGACGVSLGGLHAEACVGEGVGDVLEAVSAGGVQLERHLDQGGAVGVEGDRADLAAFMAFAHVEVSDGGASDAAAVDDLLAHLVGDVRALGFGLVLVHGVDHVADQVTDRIVFGVVHDGDEVHARGA